MPAAGSIYPVAMDTSSEDEEEHTVYDIVTPSELADIEQTNLANRIFVKMRVHSATNPEQVEALASIVDYTDLPRRVEVVRQNDTTHASVMAGGKSAPLLDLVCEVCGYRSSKYSKFAMPGKKAFAFATRRDVEDEARIIAAQLLAAAPFEDWAPHDHINRRDYANWKETQKRGAAQLENHPLGRG